MLMAGKFYQVKTKSCWND